MRGRDMEKERVAETSEAAEREGEKRGSPSLLLSGPTPPPWACCHRAKRGRPRGLKLVCGQEPGKLQLHFLTPSAFRRPPHCQLLAQGQTGMGWGQRNLEI